MSEDDYTSFHPGERMSKDAKEKAEQSRRRMAFFAPGTHPGATIENPPKQTCPFWCMRCGDVYAEFEDYMAHRCGVAKNVLLERERYV